VTECRPRLSYWTFSWTWNAPIAVFRHPRAAWSRLFALRVDDLLKPTVCRLVEYGYDLGEPAQGLPAGNGKSVGAALNTVKPAIDVTL
jgi:hypothetical protein